jgi:trehalose 6-phosphate synthase
MNNFRLINVSNRLPISLKRKNDDWLISAGAGGLVTALNPILEKHGGKWIGWLGTSDEADFSSILKKTEQKMGYSLCAVPLSEQEVKDYYFGFSNEILWPLFHSFETRCNFKSEYWKAYSDVNRKFASVIANESSSNDFIWVHDYHLMAVADHLKKLKNHLKTGFFLHIPFPPPDIFLKLPWRNEILQSLLEFDLIGVQTANDQYNLLEAVRRLFSKEIQGPKGVKTVQVGNHFVKVGVFPISIDYEMFNSLSNSSGVARQSRRFHEEFQDQKIILSSDRLDYTKGIPERIMAFRNALQRYPGMHGKATLVQVIVPSRTEVREYKKLKLEVDQLISETNGQFGRPGWTPIQHYYRNLSKEKLAAYYRASEIAMVTSLKDGMNLVAKEYVACNLEESGVLILSEFTGSAAELGLGALLINPYNIEATADALYRAFIMPEEERRARMHLMRRIVQKKNIDHWLKSFLKAAFSSQESEKSVYPFPIEL